MERVKKMKKRNEAIRKVGLAALVLGMLAFSREASASDRKGFIMGVALGGGRMGCDDCDSVNGPASAVYFGGMVNDRFAIVLDGSAVLHSEDEVTLTSLVSGVAA